MNRRDLIANEVHIATTYRREAASRAAKNPALAARLIDWATASENRAAELRFGPLFGGPEETVLHDPTDLTDREREVAA